MLKEGHKHFSGVEEAVMKNIEACKGMAQITRTSLGPNGEAQRPRSPLARAVPLAGQIAHARMAPDRLAIACPAPPACPASQA